MMRAMRLGIGGWVENMRSTIPGFIGSLMYMWAIEEDALRKHLLGQRV